MELQTARQQAATRYNASPKGRAAKARYRATTAGREKERVSSARYRIANPNRRRADNRRWYENLSPVARLLRTARFSAMKRGLEFSLVESDIQFLPTHCPVLGIELDYACGLRSAPRDRSRDNLASLDRKDNTLGYVPGNVFIVSWRANQLKSNGTAAEHHAIAVWMESVGGGNGN